MEQDRLISHRTGDVIYQVGVMGLNARFASVDTGDLSDRRRCLIVGRIATVLVAVVCKERLFTGLELAAEAEGGA